MAAKEQPSVSLLILDDNERSLEMLEEALSQPDLRIFTASDPEAGLDLVYEHHPQIVLTDLVMPKLSGIEVLERVVEFDPTIDVILMTAHYSTESAVEAIRKGAADYLNKPVSIASLEERIGRMLEAARQRQRATQLEGELLENAQFQGMIGRSPQMWDMFSRIRRVAPHYRSVLITGLTGTGKDLAARALHNLSPASKANYVALNCSAVVESLFESELFGHVKGAFTGANQDKAGLFEYANGGTLFLDEIGDMPLATQSKLLRALQNQEVMRVGALQPRKVDVRVVAATHRDLRAAIAAKEFREDLYYRLAMVEIRMPALAERLEDLPLLARHFMDRFSKQYGKVIDRITPRAQMALARHHWPGNIRELENVIGHASIMTLSGTIDVQDLPEYFTQGEKQGVAAVAPIEEDQLPSLEEAEKNLIERALARASGNQSQAARMLRIGRDALRYKMAKHKLQ